MNAATSAEMSDPSQTLTGPQVLRYGTLAVGTIAILDAFIFYGFRGVYPIRVPQSFASILLGRSAYRGGVATALLGAAVEYFGAFAIVLVYYLFSRRLPQLARSPLIYGPVYGLAVWQIMTWIVLPLSPFTARPLPQGGWVNPALLYIFGIGLTTALFASFAPVSNKGAS